MGKTVEFNDMCPKDPLDYFLFLPMQLDMLSCYSKLGYPLMLH